MHHSDAPSGTFGEKLRAAGEWHGRLCVGIDPHKSLLESWGFENNVEGLAAFSAICVDAFAGHVALVKPQVAFYEAFGSEGFAVLESTMMALRSAGTLVVADAKRGDIGSTMAGYAEAWLTPGSPLEADAVTLSPYLGFESLRPALDIAQKFGKGVFVLAATSNPEAGTVQGCRTEQGVTVSQQIVDSCAQENSTYHPAVGSVGVVVGATLATPPDLRKLHGPVLLPGVGAQGATAEDVKQITKDLVDLSFPSVSRGILSVGPEVSTLKKAVDNVVKEF
jgi:orotidine 5'-phosphate decarboxylase